MTPQCNGVDFPYTKQPLLERRKPVVPFNCKVRKRIKCVIVGDKQIGKTALAVSYSNDTFPSEYVPTAYDNYNVEVLVDGKPIRVEICDTAGEDHLIPLRNLCYPGADIFLLCFSIVEPSSFESACTRWADELSRLGAAVVLVGTQADLRTNTDVVRSLRHRGRSAVDPVDAKRLADRLNAPYIETSAKTIYNLKKAFDLAITIALRNQGKRKKDGGPWRRWLCCF